MKISQKLQAAYDARVNVILITTYGAKFSGVIINLKPLQLRCADGTKTFDDRAVERIEYN
jgi:hypothetical protein